MKFLFSINLSQFLNAHLNKINKIKKNQLALRFEAEELKKERKGSTALSDLILFDARIPLGTGSLCVVWIHFLDAGSMPVLRLPQLIQEAVQILPEQYVPS